MKASLEYICGDMDREPRNTELQVSCINSLFSVLKDEKSVDNYQRAFKAIDNALKANSSNDAIILQALNLFAQLVQIRTSAPLLEATNIFSQLIFILNAKKEDPHITEVALLTISQTISLPRMGSHFSSQQFIKTLVFVARLNSKSQIHATYLAAISMYINPRMEMALKDLCVAFVVLSRNFPRNEKLQENILSGFAQICGAKILNEVASLAIPHFTDITLRYVRNGKIIKSLLNILSQSPSESIQDTDFNIIMDQCKKFKDEPQMVIKSIEILFSKMDPKQTPIEIIPLVSMTISMFLSNATILKQALTLCYYSLSSTNDEAPISPKLVHLLTSILLLHPREPSLVRRSAAILHSLSSNQGNDIFLSQASAPFALLQAIQINIKDQHSIECIISALSNFTSNNLTFASQVISPEYLKILKQVCLSYKKDLKIIKPALLIIRTFAIAKYSFGGFLDLPTKEKEDFFIDKRIGSFILKKQLANFNLVKAVLLLMPPSPDESSLIGSAMIKYSKDIEVQFSGLIHNISDLSAINRALLICGESALKYSIKSLQDAEDILPPQTIDFLLSLNRCDAIDILLTHVKRASAPAIASQFKLQYLEQVVIAEALHDLKLWEPSANDESLIITSLYHSVYDPRQLFSALSFAKEIGLTDSSFPFLIDAISRYPTNREVVAICSEFIAALTPNKNIETYCVANNVVSTAAFALEFNKKDEPVVFSLLKLFHFLTLIDSLINYFAQSIVISMITNISSLSDRCGIQCCKIFSNIVFDSECAIILKNNKAADIAFEFFGVENYQLIEAMMENANLSLDDGQFDIAKDQLYQLSSKVTPENTAYLLQILLKCYEKEENQICDLNYKHLIPILTVHSKNGIIVQLASRLVAYSDDYKHNEELLFALLEALKFNESQYEVILPIFMLIPQFYSVTKHHATFQAQPTIELFCNLLRKYPSDVIICARSFKILEGQPIALDNCATVMKEQTDVESLMAISQYILSICDEEYDISSIIDSIFIVLKQEINDVDIYENLVPAVYYSTYNEVTHTLVLSHFDLITKLFINYTGSQFVSLAFLGIICNIATKPDNIVHLTQYAPMIGIAMKAWINNDQVLQAGSQAICNFAEAGKGDLFYTTMPVLDMALKQGIQLEAICNTIMKLSQHIGEYSSLFATDLMQLINSRNETQIVVLANCLMSMLHYKRAEDVVFDQLNNIFAIISSAQDERVSSVLLDVCASLKNYRKMALFEPLMPNIMSNIKRQKIMIAISAAKVLLNLSTIRPEIVDPYSDELIKDSSKASGELLRVFLNIKSVLFGIRRKSALQ